MISVARISAQMLQEGRQRIAEAICSEGGYSSSHSVNVAPSIIAAKTVAQAKNHIHILAACIEFNSPALLEDYVHWVAALPEKVSPFVGDISRFLQALSAVVEAQFPIDASRLITNYISRAIESLHRQGKKDAPTRPPNPLESLQRRYLKSLLEKRRDESTRLILEAVNNGVDVDSIYLNVFQPAQQEVGRMWQSGEINVAQEHYCTAATQFVMSQLQPYFMTDSLTGKTLVASCVGDELHEVGLRIVADLFEIHGWNTIYLGANAPAVSIAETLISSNAQVLAISTTMTQNLFELAEVIQVVRSHRGCEQVKILVGGYPFNVDPFLWKRVGADGDASDASEAIREADRLINADVERVSNVVQPARLPTAEKQVAEEPVEPDDDLSRLNNNLITLQRQLTKANLELAALNELNEAKTEALERADRRKDEFLAMLAHELRGPLAPMELSVSLLEMDGVNPSVKESALGTMKRQIQQMTHLINDLLDASRIAHGKIELKLEPLELETVIRRAVEIVQPHIQDKEQTLDVDLCDGPIFIQGDEIRLAQVFANLLTNASKYNENNGKIWLTTRRQRDKVVVEVKDNGVGVEADLLPDVFSTFTQEKRSRRHSMGGLGLGLSLVKQLVELHAGTVKAESEGAEKGSAFSVVLPVMESNSAENSYDAAEQPASSMASPTRRVLIVEDSAGSAWITSVLFEQLGHATEIADDGATAIQKFEQSQPQIVILDLELPDMSGVDVTRQIRQLDPERKSLIVALTGHDDDQHRSLAKESGCDEYLVKPVDLKALESFISHAKLTRGNEVH